MNSGAGWEVDADGFSKARLGSRGGELRWLCPGEEPAVGVFEGGDLRWAGAGEGTSRSLFECWRLSWIFFC